MLSKQTSKPAGFTIVETLIVLAVAGLILILVLQAIPGLGRNSRNHQRKQDVQTILEAVSHWELNHSGTIPDPSQGDQFLQFSSLSYYDPANVTVTAVTAGGASAPDQTDVDKVDVYNHQKCDTAGTASSQGAGYYDVVALYAVETGSGTASRCQQL